MARRRIDADHPLFHFKYTDWRVVPETLRPYAALAVDASKAGFEDQVEEFGGNGIPVVLQTEYYSSFERDWVVTPAELERLLDAHPNIAAVSCVEMSCSGLTGEQQRRILALAGVCSRADVYFIWEDMGYPDRRHVFARFGESPEGAAFLKEHPDTLIFVDKINGWGQYHLTRSLVLGYWLAGCAPAWGVNVEDFWWFEQGYAKLYQPGMSRAQYNPMFEKMGSTMVNTVVDITEFACPEALMGQILAAALLQGACVISFEAPDRMIAYREQHTPLFSRVLQPLQEMALTERWIPSRQEVQDKIRAAYVADDWDSRLFGLPGEQPYCSLYGTPESMERVEKWNISGSVLQQTGRYYVLPVFPAFARELVAGRYACLLDSGTDPADLRDHLDGLYPAVYETDLNVTSVGRVTLISHTLENRDGIQSFRDVRVGELALSGRLLTHSYLVAREGDGAVRLHVNNFRSDAEEGIFRNPHFSRGGYLEAYTDPGCRFLGENRQTVLWLRGAQRVEGEGGGFIVEAEPDGLKLTLTHNGPVDLTVFPVTHGIEEGS